MRLMDLLERLSEFSISNTVRTGFDDSIISGNPETEISGNVMVGVHIGAPELLVTERMKRRGRKVGLVLSGRKNKSDRRKMDRFLGMQIDVLHRAFSRTHDRSPLEMAREEGFVAGFLRIPFLCLEKSATLAATSFIENYVEKYSPATLAEVVALLYEIPEFSNIPRWQRPPYLACGRPDEPPGQIYVDLTGGTLPGELEGLKFDGADTIFVAGIEENMLEKARNVGMNVIVAGQQPSSNLGLNIVLDKLFEKRNDVEFIECAGFKRFSHAFAH